MWQNFQLTYYQYPGWKNLDLGDQNQPALSYEHIFTKDLEYVEIS